MKVAERKAGGENGINIIKSIKSKIQADFRTFTEK